jgi:hypothetical protein
MTPARPLPRLTGAAAAALLVALLAAPSAVPAPQRGGPLAGPTNLRVTGTTPRSVALAWDAAGNSGSFVYAIQASFGYTVGVPQTQTTFTWTRDMVPGRTYSFVVWAADAKGRRSADSNTVTVTLPVDTTAPGTPAVSVTGSTHSSASLAWQAVADDDPACCTYRVLVDGTPAAGLAWSGPTAVTVLRLAPGATHTLTVRAVDPSGNLSAPSAGVTVSTPPSTDTSPPTAPGNLYAFDFGCETWLFWERAADDVDTPSAILYEVRVNGVFDGTQIDTDRWITYGTIAGANTYGVQAIDSSGNRSPVSSITLENQAC